MVIRRQSKMRQAIYDVLVQNPVHPTAEFLYERLKPQFPSLSLGTVYRNLGILSEQGLIRKIQSQDAAERFDANMQPHSHVQCRCCGHLEDVFLPYDKELDARAEEVCGFHVEAHSLTFSGLCRQCQDSALG